MNKVYLVQEPLKRDGRGQVVSRFDLSKLEPYGQLVHLCSWGELRDGFDCERLMEKLRDKLQDYNDRDWIVPVGNPALIAMATIVAADINEGRVQLLDWIRNDNCYREVKIDMRWHPLSLARPA